MVNEESLIRRLEREIETESASLEALKEGAIVQQDYGKGLVDDLDETQKRLREKPLKIAELKARLERAKAEEI